jgi:GT2 family glycosyltransferase
MVKNSLVSIVVLCFNGLEEATKPCLQSIIANTTINTYELIIVDNASTDGTSEYLENFVKQFSNVRINLNNINKGYAGGNNDGLKIARGDYIVLLNNDTLVPNGWLEKLIKIFHQEQEVGLVGPVTNSAGNEQCIEIKGLNENNFEEITFNYIKNQRNLWFTTDKLGFFCVAIRRSVLEKIGYLDEKFGIGMFEDDDYCVRAKNAGFSLAIVEDCFVYHKGSYSFKKLAIADYVENFNKNRSYFFEKHNLLWTYTDIALATWAKIEMDLKFIVTKNENLNIEPILVRLNNMRNSLLQLKEMEKNHIEIGGQSVLEVEMAEKHRHLMELSDWATTLKNDNDRLSGELESLSGVFYYRTIRFLKKFIF